MNSSNKSSNIRCASFSAADAAHHVGADLGQDGRGGEPSNAGELHQAGQLRLVGTQQLIDVNRERVALGLQKINLGQQLAQQQAMGGIDTALQGFTQGRQLLAQATACQL